MKKLILVLISIILSYPVYAEQTVGEYQSTFFGDDFEIKASQTFGILQRVYIGVEAKDSRDAFILVDGCNIDLFRKSLEQVKSKYLEWVKVAKENHVTKMNKEFDVKFPAVSIAWSGTEWWFSAEQKVNMRFFILENGKMIAVWAPKVTATSDSNVEDQIYFAFEGEGDFDSLIPQLSQQEILEQLRQAKNKEKLFQ